MVATIGSGAIVTDFGSSSSSLVVLNAYAATALNTLTSTAAGTYKPANSTLTSNMQFIEGKVFKQIKIRFSATSGSHTVNDIKVDLKYAVGYCGDGVH